MTDAGIEAAAVTVLHSAIDFENEIRYIEAFVCYREGLQLLCDLVKGVADSEKKKYLRTKVEAYMGRAEKVKQLIEEQRTMGKYHAQIIVENDSTGHSGKRNYKERRNR
jgi:hypothetical protein